MRDWESAFEAACIANDIAAKRIEKLEADNIELSNCCSDYRLEVERLSIEHGDMNVQNVKDEKRIEKLEAAVDAARAYVRTKGDGGADIETLARAIKELDDE